MNVSALQQVWLVAQREITSRFKSKAFIIITVVTLAVVLGASVTGGLLLSSQGAQTTKVAVIGNTSIQALEANKNLEITHVDNREAAISSIRNGNVRAAVIPGAAPETPPTVIAEKSAPERVISALSIKPNIELLDNFSLNKFVLSMVIGFAFLIIYFMAVLMFGNVIAQNVVEEKSSRIIEILLSSMSARTLMAGKILGNSIIAIGTVVLACIAACVGLLVTRQDIILGEAGSSLIWFCVLFILSFVSIATLYAGTASLVSRQEDVAATTSPVMMLAMAPYILGTVALSMSNDLIISILSYIPFCSAPFMASRLHDGGAQWWEPVLALGIQVVTVIILISVCGRIYENSVLQTGARIRLKNAFRPA